jgi:hypothetical protein
VDVVAEAPRAREVTAGRGRLVADLGRDGGTAGWRRAGAPEQRGSEKNDEM